ncbi:hypothetical protein AAFC00_001696 [Neodothiora populina]|uniref:non-specific serine/threonine protein kinase n=1 Tax=Neodothiora populina TaxID=2781224 RepID=A0ABR3PPV0_9PEZI
MARKQMYGKRSTHVYSSFTGFASPVKSRKSPETFEVAEVAEELGRLTVHDASSEESTTTSHQSRSPLCSRDANASQHASTSPRDLKKKHGSPKKARKLTQQSDSLLSPPLGALDTEEQCEKDLPNDEGAAQIVPLDDHENDANDEPQVKAQSPSPSTIPAVTESAPFESKSEPSNIYTNHVASLLALSDQPLMQFIEWSEQLSSHFSVAKIAEASFGEVYRLSLLRPHPSLGRADESVLKIIALKDPPAAKKKLSKAARKRMEMMSDPEDVASEVRLMQRMTTIPGYTVFRECCLLQGRPGTSFVNAWRGWNDSQKAKGKEVSVFPDPGKPASYKNDQLWAVIEMKDAGSDLENTDVSDVWSIWDVFWGVVLALGKGEDDVGFEHRDLHIGNICVSARKPLHARQARYGIAKADVTKKLGFTGMETTLIDYTISRAEIQQADGLLDEDNVAFLDLEKDVSLFEGDAEEEYQYEIYRYMRSAMYLDDPLADPDERWEEVEASGRTWRGYHPQTNLVWLHFILYKLLEHFEWSESADSNSYYRDKTIAARAVELEEALARMRHMLDPYELPHSGLRSAGDLIHIALQEGWLDDQDVRGETPSSVAKGAKKTTRLTKHGKQNQS